MVNIILITLIAFTSINIYNRNIKYLNAFNCGIWGYHGSRGKKSFHWSKFDILGISNDDRGGDACGRYTGDVIEHNNEFGGKKYKDYITKFYPPKISKDNSTIIGHARKSSYFHGNNNKIQLTQPIVRWNQDEDEIEKVLVHNGTIYNTKDLIEKYEAPEFFYYKNQFEKKPSFFSKEKTNDSNIIADILFNANNNFDVLKFYQGTASLVWYDKTTDKLYMFAGRSASSRDGYVSEERPLYILRGEEHVWFSSIEEPLSWIKGQKEYEVEKAKKNTVLIFQSGKLIEEIEVNRNNSSQSQNFNHNIVINKEKKKEPTTNKAAKAGEEIELYIAGEKTIAFVIYDGEDRCKICHGTGENVYVKDLQCMSCKGSGREIKKQTSLCLAYNKNTTTKGKDLTLESFPKVKGSILLSEEIPDYDSEVIKLARLRYWDGKALAHGIIHLTATGVKKKNPVLIGEEYQVTKPYYFIKGVMISDNVEFHKWSRKVKAKDYDIPQHLMEELVHAAMHPITLLRNEFIIEESDNIEEWKLSNSKEIPLFSRKVYNIKKGECKKIETSNFGINMPEDHKSKDEINEDLTELSHNNETEEAEIGIMEADNDPYESMVRKELVFELAHTLKALSDSRDRITEFYSHKYGIRAHDLIDECYKKVTDFGEEINDGLPF